MHRVSELDPFGFARKDAEYNVVLNMSMRASLLLREEYPASAPHIKAADNKSYYIFKATVYDLKPVARFILGLSQEINVEGSQELTSYLNNQIKHVLSNKKLDIHAVRPSKRSARKITAPRSI